MLCRSVRPWEILFDQKLSKIGGVSVKTVEMRNIERGNHCVPEPEPDPVGMLSQSVRPWECCPEVSNTGKFYFLKNHPKLVEFQ